MINLYNCVFSGTYDIIFYLWPLHIQQRTMSNKKCRNTFFKTLKSLQIASQTAVRCGVSTLFV